MGSREGLAIVLVASVAVVGGVGSGVSKAAEKLPEPQLYALYSWAGNYVNYADDIQKTGIRWVRCGGWDGTRADQAALLAARNGVHLVPALGLREMSHKRTMPIDQAVKAYRERVRAAVTRYGPGGSLWKEHQDVKPLPIRYWQIWNEPNIEFLNPGQSGLLRTQVYAKLLKAASEEIRKADPGAGIIAFNTAGGVPYHGRGVPPDGMWQKLKYIGWRKFIGDVSKLAGSGCYDAIGTHPYTKPRGPEAGGIIKGIEMIRELETRQELKPKPIWFTEVGFPLEYPNNQQVRDERQQACFTVRLFAIAAAHGVRQVEIMYIEDIIYGPDNSRRSFGFFTAPGKWREQAKATEVMIDLIPDPRKDVKVLSEQADGVFAYRFKGWDGWPVIMAWNAGHGEVEHEFAVDKAATVVDLLGNVRRPSVSGGKLKVKLSEGPIYIVPPANGKARQVRETLAD